MNRTIVILIASLVLTTGCRNTQKRAVSTTTPTGAFVPPPPPQPVPANIPPPPGGSIIPQGGFPQTNVPPPVPPGAVPPGALPPGAVPAAPQGGGFPTVPPTDPQKTEVEYRWRPADAPSLSVPNPNFPNPNFPNQAPPLPPLQPLPSENPSQEKASNPPNVQLGSPEPEIATPKKSFSSPSAPEPSRPNGPAGIGQFHVVKPGLAGGVRPTLDEGLDWLKAKGYRTAIYLRAPGEPDDADRRQFEKRGIRFVSIEVSPQNLDRRQLDEFVALAKDVNLQPTFVYDQDGSIAGSIWYWYFRAGEQEEDDVSRIRARSLGLRESGDLRQQPLWQAIQRILAE